jgi:alpha-D-xyloside xylohydrolase
MSYRIADGTFHSVRRVESTQRTASRAVYRLATDEPARKAVVTVTRRTHGLHVSLRLTPAVGVHEVHESLSGSLAEHFLGTGQRPQAVDLRGRIVPLKVFNSCRSTIAVPFFLSSAGYGIRIASSTVGMLSFPGAVYDAGAVCELGTGPCAQGSALPATRICLKGSRLDYDVLAGSPEQIVRADAAIVGTPRLPPPSQFALIKWRDIVGGPEELYDDIEQLQKRRIPLGWISLDNPWERGAWGTGCYGALTFDRERFPDPKAMIERIHARGVRFMLWISPQTRIKPDGGCAPPAYVAGNVVGDGSAYIVDLTRPQAQAEFERKLSALVALGVQGFKGDRADEVDLEGRSLHGGSGTQLHNRIPVLYAQSVARVLSRAYGNDFATMSRAGWEGSNRFLPGVIGLDLPHDFRGLSEAVRLAQNAGVSGFSTWGVDVGGYSGDSEVTSEILVRWAQFAALTPIFEIGGEGVTAAFWTLGKPTVDLFRRAVILHYELFPHLYELARNAAKTGVSIIRPLGLHFPGDERAWRADQEFLLGEDLLAAPVTSGRRRGNDLAGPASNSRVYLPRGVWVDLVTGRAVVGSRTVTRPTRIDEVPLYLRRGAAIPFNLRSPDVWAKPWGLNDLDRAGRAGWLLAPGSKTTAEAGRAGVLRAVQSGRNLRVQVGGGQRETQVLALARTRPCRVSVGGLPLRELSPGELRARPSGWTYKSGPLAGVLVKLTAPTKAAVITAC